MSGSPVIADDPAAQKSLWRKIPLYIRILTGVGLGIIAGMTLRERAAPLGEVGILIIQLLKTLATPLILFAVLDAILRTNIPPRKGVKLVGISAINACVAITIGLVVADTIRGGEKWKGNLEAMTKEANVKAPKAETTGTLDPMKNIASYVPSNIIDPFQKNSVITVVLLAILGGASLRSLKKVNNPAVAPGLKYIEDIIHAGFQALSLILEWIILIIPIAIFLVVAKVVGQTGPEVFTIVGVFLGIVLLGLFIHAVLYYSFLLWAVGRTSPFKFFKGSMDAIITALSCGSSLATLPVTLRCLNDKLKISPGSARLAACVGTNLNHDGIILYEAAATLFTAQALGYDLSVSQQVVVALASAMAGIGIAGVPDAGWITLPLVLGAAGVPVEAVAMVTPLLFTVDWIIGRCRAATNVISDMTVATLLDRLDPPEAEPAPLPAAAVIVPTASDVRADEAVAK